MGRYISSLKSTTVPAEVDSAMITSLEDHIRGLDGRVTQLSKENVRTQDALKNVNNVLENQMVANKEDNLTTTEAMHRIIVLLCDLKTSQVNTTVNRNQVA